MVWDGSPSRFTDQQYQRSCLIDRGGDAPVKERCSLPIRDPDGSVNCDAVSAAKGRIGQVTGVSAEKLAAARSRLETLSQQCSSESRSRPEPGEIEERSAELTVGEDRKLRGVIPYNTSSADLGGFHEIVERGALDRADMSELVVRVDHQGLPLARFPGTLALEDRSDGLHWSCDPPKSAAAVVEAVERGDLKSSSWRMIVARDRWEGDTRYVSEIRSLLDVSVVQRPAYPAATAELRSAPTLGQPEPEPEREATVPEPDEEVTVPTGGGLTVESRSQSDQRNVESRVLSAMRNVPRGESRSLTHATIPEVEPLDLQTYLWDLLRDSSVILQSGVRVVTTTKKSIHWPTLTEDMQADFYSELDEFQASDVEFDEFELTPVKLGALARGSSEAFDDSDPSLMTIVNQNMATILALKFDKECLVGPTSAKGFDGLATIAGQELAVNGPLDSYDAFIEAFGLLSEAHVPPPYAVIMHPRTDTNLALIKEFTSSEANVTLPRPVGFPPTFITSQVGLTTGATPSTSAYVYKPGMVTVVRRMDTVIEVSREQEFTTDAILVRGRVRVVLGTVYPEAIVKLTGLAAPPIPGSSQTGATGMSAQVQTAKAPASKKS